MIKKRPHSFIGGAKLLLSTLCLLSATTTNSNVPLLAVAAQGNGTSNKSDLSIGNCQAPPQNKNGNGSSNNGQGRGNRCQAGVDEESSQGGVASGLFGKSFIEIELDDDVDNPGALKKKVRFDKKEQVLPPTQGDGRPSNGSSSLFWYGENGMDSFNLLQRGNVAAGSFHMDGIVYQIMSSDDGSSLNVTATKNTDFPPELEAEDPDGTISTRQRSLRSSSSEASSPLNPVNNNRYNSNSYNNNASSWSTLSSSVRELQQLQNPVTFDIMVVWTPKAECNNAGLENSCTRTDSSRAQMEALIELAVQETNVAFVESGINAQVRLVHMRPTNYNEGSGWTRTLSDLRGETDGNMDEVHELREIYGADMVHVVISQEEYCGIGYFGPRFDRMFGATDWSCMTGRYTFGHEIGHNMGCHHK